MITNRLSTDFNLIFYKTDYSSIESLNSDQNQNIKTNFFSFGSKTSNNVDRSQIRMIFLQNSMSLFIKINSQIINTKKITIQECTNQSRLL